MMKLQVAVPLLRSFLDGQSARCPQLFMGISTKEQIICKLYNF
jgi:hypothetical protein